MRGQHPASVHLRRLLPLVAVLGLLAPGTGTAAVPAPDLPPAGAVPAPDPAPAPVVRRTFRVPAAVAPRPVVVRQPVVVRLTPAPPPKHHRVAPKRRGHAIPIVDVTPSFVDLHSELGALPSLPRDDSKLVLAAAALLAAAAAAGTGTMLTLTARPRA